MQRFPLTTAIMLAAALAQAQPRPEVLLPPVDGGAGNRNDVPPEIVTPPRDQDVLPGGRVIFFVEVIGIPAPMYQWRLNGFVMPGQTNRILVLEKIQPSDGGAYNVSVWNRAGVATSPAAFLRVRGGEITKSADDFEHRTTWRVPNAVIQGTSADAGVDPDELVPLGGGKTVWFEWIAPADGIVTFGTRGSSFDTILTIFGGLTPSLASRITQDDDGGGFYASQVQFNARRGNVYQVQLAGFDYEGAGGQFTLAWSLENSDDLIPVLRLAPQPQGVLKGATATFRTASEETTDSYQWYFNDKPISGATGRTLTLPDADTDDIGLYHVVVRNKKRGTRSQPVGLQVSLYDAARRDDNQLALIHDKYQFVGYGGANGNRPGAGWISIGLGETVGKVAYSGANAQQGDPNPCNAPLYGTVFQGLHAEDNGIIRVDTIGSATLARMAVYLGAVGLGEVLVACDLTNGPAGLPCLIKFPATLNSNYTIVVESYEAPGNLSITCTMGVAPIPPSNPLVCAVAAGGSIQLHAPGGNWIPAPSRQWRLNGTPLTGQTGASLNVTGFDLWDVGIYTVVLSNFVSVVTNTVANLSLAGPFLLGHHWTLPSGTPQFALSASNVSAFVVETTTNLNSGWVPIATNQDPCLTLWLTNGSPLLDARRFFRAVPWP